MQPLTHESMSLCSFEHNFPSVRLMRHVSTKLYQLWEVTTCTFSLKDATLYHFHLRGRVCVQCLTYEDMSEWKVSIVLVTVNGLWNVFTERRRASTQNFDLVCKFSHRRTCLYVTWHQISHVSSRTPCVHTKVSSTRRVHARVQTLKDGCLHTFWLTKTCLCVTFNISHRVFHLTSHWFT